LSEASNRALDDGAIKKDISKTEKVSGSCFGMAGIGNDYIEWITPEKRPGIEYSMDGCVPQGTGAIPDKSVMEMYG
jgi:hypothetical protein